MSTSDEPAKFACWVPTVSGGLVTGFPVPVGV
jgi:hypothetical protein